MNKIMEKEFNSSIMKTYMTVCVAALAENGKKIVLGADNMLTIGIGTSIKYQKEDKDHKKIIKLNNNTYALFAGALHVMAPLLVYAKENIKDNNSPNKAAEKLREGLKQFALTKIEEEILEKVGFNWDIFKNKQQTLNSDIVKDLYNKINNFNLDVEIIIAGFDTQSQHSYLGVLSGNGFLVDHTLDGFLTSGSGGDLAKFSLIFSNFAQSLSVEKVKELVEKALNDAKKSPGVGDLGDLTIIPEEILGE